MQTTPRLVAIQASYTEVAHSSLSPILVLSLVRASAFCPSISDRQILVAKPGRRL